MSYSDPSDPRNGGAYRSGRTCIEPGCDEPAGTAWSPYWCVRHNIERMDRIGKSLDTLAIADPTPAHGEHRMGPPHWEPGCAQDEWVNRCEADGAVWGVNGCPNAIATPQGRP